MFSALLNLPDPGLIAGSSAGVGGLDVIDSPSPLISLGIAVAAAGVAGFLLAPLDIVRTRCVSANRFWWALTLTKLSSLILTPLTSTPRSVLPALRSLRLWGCPTSLLLPTLLHSTIPTFIATSAPLFLRSNFRIDPVLTPTAYSVCSFAASGIELVFKLPFETILRRAQMGFVSQLSYLQASTRHHHSRQPKERAPEKLETVVEVGSYTGVVSTLWRIVREEGETYEKTPAMTRGAPGTFAHRPVYAPRKGQGLQGLWRGWRVGTWGLVGVWSAAAVGGAGAKGGEF